MSLCSNGHYYVMTLWAFGFEAIDNDGGELKTELQAPLVEPVLSKD